MADSAPPRFINPHMDTVYIPREKQAGSYEVRPWAEKRRFPDALYIVEGAYFEQFAQKGQLATFREPEAAAVASVPVPAGSPAPVDEGAGGTDNAPPAGDADGAGAPAGGDAGDPGAGEDGAGELAGGPPGTPPAPAGDTPPVTDPAPTSGKPKPKKPGRA